MSQIIINTGNIANDGTGAPLRTAFNEVNNNFTQVFTVGPVGSNITIANNTIQVTNTNGNLKLATNGIGAIVPAANFVPDVPDARYIGTATNRFNTIFGQYLNANTVTLSGNAYVSGNLFVTGNTVTVDYTNANIANLTLTLADGSANAALANGAGIIVDSANANFIYDYSASSWNSSIAITATSFIGDGSQLTNVNAVVDANDLIGNVLSSTIVFSNLTSFGSVTGISAVGDISTTGNVYSNIVTGNTINGNFVGDGSNITNITASAIIGNVPFALNANSAYTANLAALATQALNADTALFAINANLAAFANVATSAQIANASQYSVQSDNANSAVVAGMAYEVSPDATLSIIGNITTDGYFIGNGSQLTGIVAVADYSNANVAAYLPIYSGNLDSVDNITTTGNIDVGSIINLPTGHGYEYTVTFDGYGSNTAQVTFQLLCDLSGTHTEWLSGIDNPGSGYAIGQEFTYDSTFLGIPGASVTISIAGVDGSGGVTDLAFTVPPLYPPSITRQDSFISLQVDDYRWTFGVNGNLTLPSNTSNINYSNGVNILDEIASNYGNANVADFLPTYTGNLAGDNISVTGNVYTDGKILHLGEITGNGIVANGAGIIVGANVAEIVYDNSVFGWTVNQGWHPAANVAYNLGRSNRYWNNFYALNINTFDIAVANSINVTNSASVANLTVINNISAGGNVTASNFTTSGSNGNITGAYIISAEYLYGDGSNITGLPPEYGNANVADFLPTYTGNLAGNNISITGNVYSDGKILTLGDSGANSIVVNGAGIVAGANVATILYDNTAFGWTVNQGWHPSANATYNIGRSDRYWHNLYALEVNSSNISVGNGISAVGDITANNFNGNVNATSISVTGNINGNILTFTTATLNDAGSLTSSVIQKNQNPPYGSESYGIELLTTTDDPSVFSSVSAGPDYVALLSTNAGNANVIVQGGYGITLSTSNASGGSIKEWSFVSSGDAFFPGNLSLSHGTQISEVPSPVPGNYALALAGTGAVSPDQQLLVYPTAVDANHLHLTSGNLYNTELFLGNDDLYVKLANTGNVVINSNDNVGNTAQWVFDTTGNLTLPNNTFQVNYANGTPVSLSGNATWATLGNVSNSNGPTDIALGQNAGNGQASNSVAIGNRAGENNQGTNSVAIGVYAGNVSQGSSSVAVGAEAGGNTQGVNAVAIGVAAGYRSQGNDGVAVGSFAGQYDQSDFAIAIGSGAAATGQGYGAIAIGTETTTVNQGDYSIAIGFTASNGTLQPSNSIIIDAGNIQLAATGPGFFINPVRNDTSNVTNAVYYNTSTKEVTYGPAGNSSNEAAFDIQSSDFNATIGNRYGVDTTSAIVTATLPLVPVTGGAIFFADAGGAFATNNLIINPNGQTIMGASGNMTVSTNNQSFGLFFNGTTWRTYSAG